MARIDQLGTQSPASVAAMRSVVGMPALETRVTTVESDVQTAQTTATNAASAAAAANTAAGNAQTSANQANSNLANLSTDLQDALDRVQVLEETISTPTISLVPKVVTLDEDESGNGNVFDGATTTTGTLTVREYWVAGITGTAAPGVSIPMQGVGRVRLYVDGEWAFEPDLNWNGVVPTITYMATNGTDLKISTLNITVTAVDDAPIATPNAAMTQVNEPVSFPVLNNDYDPEGAPVTLTHVNGVAVVVGQPISVPNGSITVDEDSILTFTPTADYEGVLQFPYTISANGLSATGTVSIKVGFENMPLISPVAPIVAGDEFDAAAVNFGNTAMGRVGEAYNNGVNVTNATYTPAQGRFDLATSREPWLYDRPTQIYKLYLRTEDPTIREKALEFAELYFQGVVVTGDRADFTTGGGTALDPKYQYPIIGWWYEKETGDIQYRPRMVALANSLYHNYEATYSEAMPLWTERNMNYALQGQLAAYWMTGDQMWLDRAYEYFEGLLAMSEATGAPLHPHWQHEGSNTSTLVTSPWMAGMLIETLIQFYRTTNDNRVIPWIARYCDFVVDHAFYVNYEVATFLGHRIPAYLVGLTQTFQEGNAAADAEHCYDIAILLLKGIWAKQILGQDTTEMQQVVFEQLEVARRVFQDWTRSTVGYPRYRVNPPRKYGWWFNGAYSTIYAAGQVPMGPIITALPQLSGSNEVGAVLTATPGVYEGSPVVTRQWLRSGTPIAGATNLTYTLQEADSGESVVCEETALLNGVEIKRRSAPVIPTAAGAPTITAQPSPQTVTEGQSATFSFTASGSGLTYGWQTRPNSSGSWTTVSGETGTSYQRTNAQLAQSGMEIRGFATNSSGTTYTNAVALTVNAIPAVAPSVTSQPSNQSVQEGSPATFSLTYTGTAPVTLQWYTRISAGSWEAVSGATTAQLTTGNLLLADDGREYRCQLQNSAGSVYSNTVSVSVEAIPEELFLVQDLSYVDTGSAPYTAFINFVNNKRGGGNPYGYMPSDAALAYRITNDESYRTLAIAGINEMVTEVENAIAANQNATVISGDSYLEVGPKIGGLAMVYAWCNPDQTTKDRWAAVADQAVYNIWNHTVAEWGGNSFPWTGWSVNDPGNNYHYSFLSATAYWALASNDHTLINFLNTQKLPALRAYFANLEGGGSREGTGYGAAFRTLFAFYEIWQDSGMPNLSASNSHLDDSIDYWIHATMPTLDRYCPIGDLARESYPNLFDYHRELVLRARHLTEDTRLQNDSSWWLNNIDVQVMSQGFMHSINMLPAGTNTNTPPAALSYYSQGTGSLFSRTSWDTDAVFFHFMAGIYDQSHAAMEQGSFTLFRNEFLAATNNNFSHSGIQQGVKSRNVLRFETSGGTVINQNNGTATQTNNIGPDGNVTATANLKPIINNATVTAWQRAVDFTNGILQVNDTYSTTSGTTAIFQVCTPVQPVVTGNVVTAGDLQIRVITPGSPTISVVQASSEDADFNDGWRVDIRGGTGTYVVEMRSLTHSPEEPAGEPVTINSHPADQSVNNGQNATFTVSASGTAPITYQWQWRATSGGTWADVSGQTAATYVRSAVTGDNGSQVRCAVTNAEGTVYTNAANLTVTAAPSITAQPANATVTEGQTANFSITATGATSYQWQFMASGGSWTDVAGQTTNAYARVTVLGDNGGQVRCAATNAAGTTYSNAATLTVNAANVQPTISAQPTNQTVDDGQNATFSVTAAGGGLAYSWESQAAGGGAWTPVSGANTNTYVRPAVLADTGMSFRCVISNDVGSVTSNAVTLTVEEVVIPLDPLTYAAILNEQPDGIQRNGNLFPGGSTYTMQALVIFDEGTPDTWANGNTIMGVQYTNRLHTVGLNNVKQFGARNNESTNANNFAVEPNKWYLVSFSSDSGVNLAGQIRLTFQEYEGETDPTLLSSTQSKGEYFGGSNAMQAMSWGGAVFGGTGWPRAMRMTAMRCYDHVRSDTQLRADRRNTNPTGALWWWEAQDDGAGNIQFVDITGNSVAPTLVGTITLGEGPEVEGGGEPADPMRKTFVGADETDVVANDPTLSYVGTAADVALMIENNMLAPANDQGEMQCVYVNNVRFTRGARSVSVVLGGADNASYAGLLLNCDGTPDNGLMLMIGTGYTSVFSTVNGVQNTISGTEHYPTLNAGDVLTFEINEEQTNLRATINGTQLFSVAVSAAAMPVGDFSGAGFYSTVSYEGCRITEFTVAGTVQPTPLTTTKTFTASDGTNVLSTRPTLTAFTPGAEFEIWGNNMMVADAATGLQMVYANDVQFTRPVRKVTVNGGLVDAGGFAALLGASAQGGTGIAWGTGGGTSQAFTINGETRTPIAGTQVAMTLAQGDVLELSYDSRSDRLVGKRNGTDVFSVVVADLPLGPYSGAGLFNANNTTNTGILSFTATESG